MRQNRVGQLDEEVARWPSGQVIGDSGRRLAGGEQGIFRRFRALSRQQVAPDIGA